MMPGTYRNLVGETATFDLDAVVRVVSGWSGRRPGWQAYVVYLPHLQKFVELQSTPPDVRGNSADEAEEVPADYVQSTFNLTLHDLGLIRRSPRTWRFIERR